MSIERTTEGLELRLVALGAGRYATSAFLAFWLCGWAAGEAFALWALFQGGRALLTGGSLNRGGPPLEPGPALLAGAFLLVWLALWTLGGVAAFSELLRQLWGEDRVAVSSGRLTVIWARGPFRSRREFERDAIRRVSLMGRDDRLTLETIGPRVELSGLGTRAERSEGARALQSELAIPEAPTGAAPLPPAWEEVITPEGERALVPRRSTRTNQARFTSVLAMLLAALTFVVARQAVHRPDLFVAAFILFAFVAGLAAATVWLARGRSEWRIGSGRLTLRRRFGSGVRDVFEARRLVLDMSTDSDGDAWYELNALGEGEPAASPAPTAIRWRSSRLRNGRSVARLMNDAASVRDLGQWLARETGLELQDLTHPQARELQLAELRALLENSGRFGQWAARQVDRLSERQRKIG